MTVKYLMKKFLFGYRASSSDYIKHLKNKGVDIGDDVVIFAPANTIIDDQNPHMLKIGSNVSMTGPITILTHDYSTVACKKIGGG